jgi:hypothetical protein
MDIQPSAALDRQKIIYNSFYTAFHPGSQLRKQYEHAIEHASDPTKKASLENKFKDELANPFKEDEIYPGLKRPDAKYDNEKTVDFRLAGPTGVSSKGSSSSSNGGKGTDKSAKENMSLGEKTMNHQSGNSQWVKKWKEYDLDLKFMHALQHFLQVHDNSEYLPLNDMHIDTYNVLRDAWTHNRIKFMQGQFWVNQVLGVNESLRRIKTMVDHVAAISLVENWKLIKNHLIDSKQLTAREAKSIENYFSLSVKFPNPLKDAPIIKETDLVMDCKRPILESIKKSLGIMGEYRPIPIRSSNTKSEHMYKLYDSTEKILPMIRSNGVALNLLFGARNLHVHQPGELKTSLEELSKYYVVPWEISAEKNFLSKV